MQSDGWIWYCLILNTVPRPLSLFSHNPIKPFFRTRNFLLLFKRIKLHEFICYFIVSLFFSASSLCSELRLFTFPFFLCAPLKKTEAGNHGSSWQWRCSTGSSLLFLFLPRRQILQARSRQRPWKHLPRSRTFISLFFFSYLCLIYSFVSTTFVGFFECIRRLVIPLFIF